MCQAVGTGTCQHFCLIGFSFNNTVNICEPADQTEFESQMLSHSSLKGISAVLIVQGCLCFISSLLFPEKVIV